MSEHPTRSIPRICIVFGFSYNFSAKQQTGFKGLRTPQSLADAVRETGERVRQPNQAKIALQTEKRS